MWEKMWSESSFDAVSASFLTLVARMNLPTADITHATLMWGQ
jgi:hypothetical protein